jgi:hypothetical protein
MAVGGVTRTFPAAGGWLAEHPAWLIANGIACTADAEHFKPERFGSLR